jgi:hypothetical protein
MRRILCALAALLGLSYGSATAYYIEVTIDLNHLDKIEGDDQNAGMAGAVGNLGGQLGQPNMAGNLGALGNRGGSGIGGFGGRGAGMAGAAGFGGRGAGMAGIAGAGSGQGPPRGGMAGVAGFGGSGQGPPRVGMGGLSGFGGRGFAGTESETKDLPPAKITVRFELKTAPKKKSYETANKEKRIIYQIAHKWGHSTIVESDLIKVNSVTKVDKIDTKYKKEKDNARKAKGDKVAQLHLARWALQHDQVKDFPKIMEDVAAIDPNDRAVVAFRKVEAAINLRPSGDDPGAAWIKSKTQEKYETKTNPHCPHYLLITNSAKQDEIDGCLKRLEDNFRTFYYWFALQGQALQVPKYRLVAVLLTEKDVFENYHSWFKTIPVEAAGFTARRDNVPIMYSKRLDNLYVQLDKENNRIWQKAARPDLLKGTESLPKKTKTANEQVLTLVQQVMEEETKLATITHEGTRQLLAVTGLPQQDASSPWTPMLARTMSGPEWVRFGMASFFESPEGAYWPGAAIKSWKYHVQFLFLLEDKKLDDAWEVLKKVITDKYFREAQATGDKEKLETARATSWALAYYLASGDDRGGRLTSGLIEYFRLLSKLPRDMELSDAAMRKAFDQAFNLADENAEKQFAIQWLGAMRRVKFEVAGFWSNAQKARKAEQDALKAKEDDKNAEGGPARPPQGGIGPMRPPMGGFPNGPPPMGPPNRPKN